MEKRLIELSFPIVPRAQRRPRAMGYTGADGRPRARVYKSQQAETDEADFFALAMAHPDRPKTPLTGPVEVTIYAFLPQPKSVKSDFHVVKPDLDNLMKFALDCLTRARYWADDKQISVLYGLKLYGTPEWRIHIWYYPDKEGK